MDVVCCLAPPLQSQNNESCTNDIEMCEWATPLIKEPWNHNAVHLSVHACGQYKNYVFKTPNLVLLILFGLDLILFAA